MLILFECDSPVHLGEISLYGHEAEASHIDEPSSSTTTSPIPLNPSSTSTGGDVSADVRIPSSYSSPAVAVASAGSVVPDTPYIAPPAAPLPAEIVEYEFPSLFQGLDKHDNRDKDALSITSNAFITPSFRFLQAKYPYAKPFLNIFEEFWLNECDESDDCRSIPLARAQELQTLRSRTGLDSKLLKDRRAEREREKEKEGKTNGLVIRVVIHEAKVRPCFLTSLFLYFCLSIFVCMNLTLNMVILYVLS